jgi:RHS repeat-associated protein
VHYYFSDHLGTHSLITDANGTMPPQEESDYFPYGGEIPVSGSDPNHYKFTGKERDSESGMDNFGARYDSSTMGRFMTPDPLLNSGQPSNPQTWNRYAYTLNNPLSIVDPTGLYNLINDCIFSLTSSGFRGFDECTDQFDQDAQNLKNAIRDLDKAADNEFLEKGDSEKLERLFASLDALGTQNDGNNVTVVFGPAGSGAETKAVRDPKTGELSFTVTFPSGDSKLGQANNAAHEGTHIADDTTLSEYPSLKLSPFSFEYRAYQTGAWAVETLAEARGAKGSLSIPARSGQIYEIWNSSWGVIDENLTRLIVKEYKYTETQPHNPWGAWGGITPH